MNLFSFHKMRQAIEDGICTQPVFTKVENTFGEALFSANCFPQKQLKWIQKPLFLYNGWGGQGTVKTKSLAGAKAIAEILERWA
jgi:hypothetical protein